MSTNHTPGPWYIVPTLTGAISINKDKKIPLATVGGASWHLGTGMCEANARLMAAAPDLLAAGKSLEMAAMELLHICRNAGTDKTVLDDASAALDAMFVAIRKAEGSAPCA